MSASLSVAYITSRSEPEFQWMYDSIRRESDCPIIVIQTNPLSIAPTDGVSFHHPKPNVWQGPHRLTREDFWAKSNALNTAICLCKTEWFMHVDDRSVLLPGWFARVKAAMDGNYAMCGKYEKRHGMQVVNGIITEPGAVTGEDVRAKYLKQYRTGTIMDCPGEWWFGCLGVCPLAWALAVNGFSEFCDGSGFEDVFFGMSLKNSGYPLKYDSEFAMVEDREPGKLGRVMRREDKGVSPNDKSHAMLARLRDRKQAEHPINLRDIRQAVLQGQPFPPPHGPTRDWWDNQALVDMK